MQVGERAGYGDAEILATDHRRDGFAGKAVVEKHSWQDGHPLQFVFKHPSPRLIRP